MAELDGIYNFLPLTDHVATAGQPTEAELSAVKAAGYEAVINLLPADSSNALADEEGIVSRLGLAYIHIPVDWAKPEAADAERFFDALDAYQDRRVFVHCAANMRVSAFMYLYRALRQHVPPAEAVTDLHRIWTPNETWQRFMDGFGPAEGQEKRRVT